MSGKLVLIIGVLISLVCSVYSDTFVQITSDAQFRQQFNNDKYSGILVNYMTTYCSHSKYLKPFFEQYSAQYLNINFVEVFLDKFIPNSTPGISGNIQLPTLVMYNKNGQKIDSIAGHFEPNQLESLIIRNGGKKAN